MRFSGNGEKNGPKISTNPKQTTQSPKSQFTWLLTQRGIGSIVERKSTLKTSKGEKTYSRYWIYVPTDVAEDKAFPFKAGDKLLISITEGRKVVLEKA